MAKTNETNPLEELLGASGHLGHAGSHRSSISAALSTVGDELTATDSDSASAPTRADEVSFITGVDASGTIVSQSFHTWNGDSNPDTYNSSSSDAFHWGATNKAGTAGGTVDYYFDPASNYTAAEQTALASGLAMWQAVANIQFVQTTSAAAANITFTRNSSGSSETTYSYTSHAAGDSTLTPPSNVKISIDSSTGTDDGFGELGNFTENGGYGVQVVLHEIGHSLGLGHGGPYNGTATASQQLGPYDSRVSTIMSYFNPQDAKDFASPVGTVNWGSSTATTWMPVDIDAIQRLYGASTTGPLTQAQTFGYNTTITGSLQPYFDFNTNTAPVITIYDSAKSGNTLDLSGSGDAETVNLNPGAYSSILGLTNNVAIYDKTYIQNADGGSGNDSFTVNAMQNNTINGEGGANTAVFGGNSSEYSISTTGGVTTVTRTASADTADRPNGVVDTLTNVQTLQFADQSMTLCFGAGTRIRVVRAGSVADVAVEELRVGDIAVTASGATRPIRWLGHRTKGGRGRRLPASACPVRVAAGAFGGGLPARDLTLSPGHPVLVGADDDGEGGHLVPIMCLVNGTTVRRVAVETVTYWHVELDRHDILLAEGLPAESYLDGGDRAFFSEADAHALTNPDFVVPGLAGRCRPVAVDGLVVEAERARLDTLFAMRLAAACVWPDAHAC